MRELHSKLLVILESLLFLAPVTLLTIWYSWFLVGFYAAGLASEPAAAHVAPALILLGFAVQILAWWVVGVFILRGRQGLANLGRPFIAAIYLGAALAVAGGVSLALLYIFRGRQLPASWLSTPSDCPRLSRSRILRWSVAGRHPTIHSSRSRYAARLVSDVRLPMSTRTRIGLALAAMYGILSLICAFAPDALPGRSILSSLVVGPPLLLVWGSGLWLPYAVVTFVLGGLTSVVLWCRTPEAKIMAGFAGTAIWCLMGFFAVALSV